MKGLKQQLDEAYSLAADRKDYQAALSSCDLIIETNPELTAPLRTRAQIYAHKADFKNAIDDMASVIQKGPVEPGDYFFRGWWNLEDDNGSAAIEDLTEAIEIGKQLGDDYFAESAHFFRAVACLRLGRYADALADCQHVSDDFLIHLRSGQISKHKVVNEARSKGQE
jgi:tetratricopeptide (TPR) repeat protein